MTAVGLHTFAWVAGMSFGPPPATEVMIPICAKPGNDTVQIRAKTKDEQKPADRGHELLSFTTNSRSVGQCTHDRAVVEGNLLHLRTAEGVQLQNRQGRTRNLSPSIGGVKENALSVVHVQSQSLTVITVWCPTQWTKVTNAWR